MGIRRARAAIALLTSVLATGCVDRRYVVETNVPGAVVSVDGVRIGPSPADARWEYAGKYEFHAVAPGYEPLTQCVDFRAKWYQYPPFDFFAEVLWPGRIEDVRRVRLMLQPEQPVDQVQLLNSADALRARGNQLPPSSVPDETPATPTATASAPLVTPPLNSVGRVPSAFGQGQAGGDSGSLPPSGGRPPGLFEPVSPALPAPY